MPKLPRILVIRTYWHPAVTPGSRRLESFCRYLAEDGWDVTLVALRPPVKTEGADAAIPYRRIWLEHSIRAGSVVAGLEHRIRKWFPGVFGDGYAEARIRVHRAAANLLKTEHFDCLLTTFPFAASLQVTDRLHRRFGVPWVADLRDLPDEFDASRERWSTRRSSTRLAVACRSAAHITTVSGPLQRALETRYGLSVPVDVIQNGYDEEAFQASAPPSGTATFDITFCGGARRGDGRTATLLGQGLSLLQQRGADLSGVRIVLVGGSGSEGVGLGPADQLPVPLVRLGVVPHIEALTAMRASSVLVSLASAGAEGILTSKVFEYARAGRPVLSIPQDRNVLDEFIHRARIGKACDTPEEVADFLSTHIDSWRRSGQLPEADADWEYLAGFSRRALALNLGKIIRSCF